MDNEQKKPELVHRDGSLKATVWRNEGEKGPYFTTSFARTYADKEGKPRDTQSFSQTDLLRLAELGRETYGMINDLKQELRQKQSQTQTTQPQHDPEYEAFKKSRNKENGQVHSPSQNYEQ